ncbi:phage virion morphogenesis protein [Vibrio mediterranei]|uniref:phage virion morphogenesis protein n=1 Tax=Vibrio mediterranei TaxID=689 RepID=UPI001EFD5E6F|nr:phage virion morphogenesis protein [Vibrio mediterranei]MCG9624632.1 phage virion morphogenesis protein [Vibrio mediterranei]
MAGVSYSMSVDDALITQALNRLIQRGTNLEPALRDIGELLLVTHDQRFKDQTTPDGTPWQPLSANYSATKPKRKDDILTLNSILSGTLSYQVSGQGLDFGTALEYGAIHHFGGSSDMRPQNAAIPAREWLGLDPNDPAEIFDILSDFLVG